MGLNPLGHMDIIKSQAYSHTEYMVETNEVNHDNFFERSNYLKAMPELNLYQKMWLMVIHKQNLL